MTLPRDFERLGITDSEVKDLAGLGPLELAFSLAMIRGATIIGDSEGLVNDIKARFDEIDLLAEEDIN